MGLVRTPLVLLPQRFATAKPLAKGGKDGKGGDSKDAKAAAKPVADEDRGLCTLFVV